MLALSNLSYRHPNRDLVFESINLTINKQNKCALIGNNGAGKSTLLKILAGQLQPSAGTVIVDSRPYYVPQHVGQFNDLTVSQALKVADKLNVLKEITDGNASAVNLAFLDDDWLIEERCNEALAGWNMDEVDLNQRMMSLSGGQKTKIFLAGIAIHQPEIVLLDEPSNHMDAGSRQILYDYIRTTSNTLVVVSHDKTLLNLLNCVYELSGGGVTVYGGNYNFYAQQKNIHRHALAQDLRATEKALRKAKEVEKESLERKQKLDTRGKKKQEKAGLPRISMNTFKNNAEKSTSRLKDVHSEKIETISKELRQIRKELPGGDKMKIDLDHSALHRGKKLVEVKDINFGYEDRLLWKQPLGFLICSGDRIVIRGDNGSGKTTLIKIILGEIQPQSGIINRTESNSIYIDQDYSLIDNNLTVYEEVVKFNYDKLQEHELKIRLNRFLFTREFWDKSCEALSGGEKMRLMLCCLMISNRAPDIIILDEPTNNLDIQNTEILTAAINEYNGTLIVVSHDSVFLNEIGTDREIVLK